MKRMKGKSYIGLLVGLGIMGMVGLVCGLSYISAYNYGARMDASLDADYSQMKNVLGQYSLKVNEAVQIPGMKKDDLKEVTSAAMAGRYGEGGSKAVFQWIQENYPGQVTDTLYLKVQQIIEAGRNDFANTQKKFIDTRRQYTYELDTLWKGTWLSVAGRPKVALDTYKLIESQHGKDTFETGTDTGLKLR